jgi:predicted  nucleic acid-binding Zn-ribbon protein
METRADYVTRKKRELDDWRIKMEALESNAKKVKEDLKGKYAEHLAALRAKRAEGEKRLDAIKAATDDSWEMLKAETENVWEAFKDSLNQFKLHFN